jgi:hypothetical protein
MWNPADRRPGRQARLKDQKVDLPQYPGEENPAGTISLVRHSYQTQRDPLFHSSTLLTQSRRDRTRKSIHIKHDVRLKKSCGRSAKKEHLSLLFSSGLA